MAKLTLVEFHNGFQHEIYVNGNTFRFKEIRLSDGKVLQDTKLSFDSAKEMAERLLPYLDEADKEALS